MTLLSTLIGLGLAGGLAAQQPVAVSAKAAPPPIPVEEIIQKFAAKEAEFRRARDHFTYRQTVRIQELDDDGVVRGRFEVVSDIIFTPQGKRLERVVYAPVSTLRRILLTPEDEQDLRDVQPFVLTTVDLPKYNLSYMGPQKVDEIEAYVFSVKPKGLETGQRYFEGQIWVDQQDLQIVKTYGKAVGVKKKGSDNQFPRFETYRDQVDGKFWFPVHTRADDVLQFEKTGDQRIRMMVKYEDYKQFRALTDIKYADEVDEKKTPAPGPKAPEKKK